MKSQYLTPVESVSMLRVQLCCINEFSYLMAPSEAHKRASRGGETETLPSPRLQQGFHDRPLPAATRQAHPHRYMFAFAWHFHMLNKNFIFHFSTPKSVTHFPENYVVSQHGNSYF